MGKATASRIVLPPNQLHNSLFLNGSFRDCAWLINIEVSDWKTDVRVSVGRISAIVRCPEVLPVVENTQDIFLIQ